MASPNGHRRFVRALGGIVFLALGICKVSPCQAKVDQHLPIASDATPSSAIDMARRQISLGDFQGAEVVLKRYLAMSEGSADGHALLGYVKMRLNQPKESLQEFTRAAELRTPTAEELRTVADDYVLLDDLTDADHWMSRSLQLDPRDPETWYGLGRIRYSLQHFQDAAQCFEKTLEFEPRSVKAANNLGLAYEGQNRSADAEREYRLAISWQAASSHPSEQPLLNLATMLLHQSKGQEALPLLTQAVAIAPEDPHIHDQLGHFYLTQNALPEAQAQFEKAVSLVPQSGAYHFLLGQVYRRRGMTSRAKEQFRLAAASDKHASPQ